MKFLILILALPQIVFATAVDLQKSFEIALQHNESVQIQEKSVEKAHEQKNQAVGSVLPNLSAIGTYTKQDVSDLTTAQKSSILEDSTGAKISLQQPLFKGTREYAAMRASSRNVEAEEFSLQQVRRSIYGKVAQDFYQWLNARRDIENIKTLVDLSEQRTGELQKRAKVGRVRKGELLQAQAQAAAARAQLVQAQATSAQAQTSFFELTGLREADLVDSVTLPSSFPALDACLLKLEDRPDIKSYKKKSEYADEQVSIAEGAHLPNLDLTGNYYLKRDGSLEKVKWDAGLVLTIPLFEGGVTQSKVREASATYRQSELTLAQARRTAEKEIRDLHSLVTSGADQIQKLKESAQLAEANYREQTRDNRFGLVTSLDVISALNTYIESKRSLDRVIYQTKAAYAQLRAATGEVN